MKTTVSKKRKVLLSATIALVATATSGAGLLSAPRATAETLSDFGGFISYDASQVTITEDASAVVPFSTPLTNNGLDTGSYGNGVVQFTKLNDNMAQLDSGRSGLHLKTVKSGTEAEGAGVSFKGTLEGDFSMDFRVFSEQSFYGKETGTGVNQDVSPDYYNTFLDAKEIGVTIASATTDDAFTIFVRGASLWGVTNPNARVWVKGETFENGGVPGLKGYGLADGELSYSYPVNTLLKGTSFVNGNDSGYDTYTTLEFDVETMCVYAVSYTATIKAAASSAVPSRVLIRDLSQYPKLTGSTANYDSSKLTLLDSEAFADGYTVSVAFTDVTADDTKLQTLANGTGDDAHGSAIGTDVTDGDGNAVTYARHGNMIIYSLNGQSFAKDKGFTTTSLATQTYTKWHDGTAVTTTQYQAIETGLNAEGASIEWKEKQTGVFEEEIFVRTNDKPAQMNFNNYSGANKIGGGMGFNGDGHFPAYNLKELAFDFVSASDPDKKFTLFVKSCGGTWSNLPEPSARVYIPGDTVLTSDLEYGYGLSTGRKSAAYDVANAGVFDPNMQSKLLGWFGWTLGNNSFGIKFDPTEMKVYGLVEKTGTYAVIRDLATNSGTNVPTANCASLSASDFEDGYYIKMRVNDVRRSNFTIEDRVMNSKGTVTTIGGRNDAATVLEPIACFGFRYTTTEELNVSTSETAEYNKQLPTAKIATMVLDEENELKPVFFGVMSSDAAIVGEIAFANGTHTGSLTLTDGACTFVPTEEGEYTFTYNVSWNGQTIEYVTKAIAKDVYSAIVFKNGTETLATVTVENGKAYSIAAIAPAVSLEGYSVVGWTDGETQYGNDDKVTFTADGELQVVKTYGVVSGATITLGGEIGVNFYVTLPEAATTQTATFTVGGAVVETVQLAEAAHEENVYKLTYVVAPKDFRTEITVTVNGETEKAYSAEAYLNTVISDASFNAEDKAIAQATLNYCSIASKYFDSVATDVTVAALTEDELEALEAYKHTADLEGMPAGVSVLGPRLVLESETAIRIYFSSGTDLTQETVTVNGNTSAIVKKEAAGMTVYYAEVTDIAAKDLDVAQTIVLSVGGEAVAEIAYSALSYVRSALLDTNTDSALVEMVTALYRYNQAANEYFA